MTVNTSPSVAEAPQGTAQADTLDIALDLARSGRRIIGMSLLAGVLALGGTYLVKPTFTSVALILPPQQQQSLAASALSSLGALASLAGGAGIKSPIDQHVALLQSTTIADRVIDRFKLGEVYDEELRSNVRKELGKNLRVSGGKRDGLITIELDDHDPQRAADMATAFVDEFRRLTSELAITEAQQRKVFFEQHLEQTRKRLADAQTALQSSGVSAGALKAEPKAAAEGYAKLKAEYTTAQVRLQALMANFTAAAPEVIQQQSALAALRAQLDKIEARADTETQHADYISKYREFKYQETLFELFSRQYELARVDESREGGLVQVVDAPQVPDRKSRPKRAMIAVGVSLATGIVMVLYVLLRARWRHGGASAETRAKAARLWPTLWGRG